MSSLLFTLHRAITITYKILCQAYCTLHRAITVTYKILCQAYCTLHRAITVTYEGYSSHIVYSAPCDNCYI